MAKLYKYTVDGSVGYMESLASDPDYFCGKKLSEAFMAPNDEAAIIKADKIITEFLRTNEKYDPRVKGALEESSFCFRLQKKIFGMEWVPHSFGEAAVPAIPAKVAIPAHVKATRW